jgi:hypothetical protein
MSGIRASKEIVPFLRIIFKNNEDMAAGIARWLELDTDMISYIVGSEEKAAAILKRMS